LQVSFDKMSKSKHNGVDPTAVIDRYGADTARLFILFKAPPEKDLEWEDADVEGQFRFLQRLWRLVEGARDQGVRLAASEGTAATAPLPGELGAPERDLRRAVHTAIQAISRDLEGDLQLNTAVSELMKLTNALTALLPDVRREVAREAVHTLVLLLAPFAPHLAEELWHRLAEEGSAAGSVHRQAWPPLDASALARETIPLVIQVKGKVRGNLEVPADADASTLERLALESEVAAKWLAGQPPRRVIVVPGKLVNLVP
jgi:leucyl-tRNA synthetase